MFRQTSSGNAEKPLWAGFAVAVVEVPVLCARGLGSTLAGFSASEVSQKFGVSTALGLSSCGTKALGVFLCSSYFGH